MFKQILISVFAVGDRVHAGIVWRQAVIHRVKVIAEVLNRVGDKLEQIFGAAVDKAAPMNVINDFILRVCLISDGPAGTMLKLDFLQR